VRTQVCKDDIEYSGHDEVWLLLLLHCLEHKALCQAACAGR